jgi:CHAT domain-containing protein
VLNLSSLESARSSELEVTISSRPPPSIDLTTLREAEQALITADLARRHWEGAPTPKIAEAKYSRAIELATQLHDVPLLRLALTQKARFLLFEKSRFPESRTLLQQAIDLPSANDDAQQAIAFKTLASTEDFLGNYDLSINAGERALELYRQTGDIYWQGIVLGNLASAYQESGRSSEAATAIRQALADAETTQDAAGVVYCLSQLAEIYRRTGQFELALQAFQEALAWGDRIHYAPLIEAEIEKELGLFYAQLGFWNEAEFQLRRCLLHLEQRDSATSLETRGLLASALQHKGELANAIREYGLALSLADKLHLPREGTLLLLQRSSAFLAQNRRQDALNDIEHASVLANQITAPALLTQVALARGAVYVGHSPDQSESAYHAALTMAEQIGDREQQASALAGIAQAKQKEGDLLGTLASIDRALDIVEHSRSGLHNRELGASYFTQYRVWYELAVDIAMQLAQQNPGKGYERDAFCYAERMRARALLDTLTQGGASAAGLSKEVQQRIAVNQQAIEEQQSSLSRNSGNVAVLADKLKQLYQEQDALSAASQAEMTGTASMISGNAVTVEEVQQKLLSRNSVFLSYSVGAHNTYRWLITPSSIQVRRLPSQLQMGPLLRSLQTHLASGRPQPRSGEDVSAYSARQTAFDAQLDQELARAGSMLLQGIPSATRQIFVVADGALLSLPWSALRLPCAAGVCYAVERFAFLNEPSASVAIKLAQISSASFSTRIAVIADPLTAATSLAGRNAALPSLPGSGREALAISRLASTDSVQLVRGSEATPTAVRTLTGQNFSIFHFAAHTVLVPNHPELSGIALSPTRESRNQESGVLWLRDIYALHLPYSLVVLSGCDTQGGRQAAGEGLNSLAQAFFFAGAHSVVGSLWKVDDDATVELMQRFYRNMIVEHVSPSVALRTAQLSILHTYHTQPFVWAAFVLNGLPDKISIERATR